MREIKFRVWDGQMLKCSLFKVHADGHLECAANLHKLEFEPVLMQYTGLKDKNGVEIYEGDICTNESGRIGRCIYHEFTAGFDFLPINSKGDTAGYEPQMWRYRLEVIGNIHENPDLLNEVES